MKLELHWKIIIGLVLGLIFGVLAAANGWSGFTTNWIAPFGKIFINLLKLIAVPLVLSSLITGVASLSDLKKLSRIGGKTITIYIVTTAISVTIGLVSVNLLKPGDTVPEDMKVKLQETYKSAASGKLEAADQIKERRPLQPIVDMVPSNFFSSASNNRNMLQVVFVAIIIGIALIQIPKNKARPVLDFMEGINDLVIKLVDNIMLMAPIGVFALIADTITSIAGDNLSNVLELLSALGFYMLVVIIGLTIQMVFTYTAVLKIFSNMSLNGMPIL
jgi:Na+/H+-dicarboxylate symporter